MFNFINCRGTRLCNYLSPKTIKTEAKNNTFVICKELNFKLYFYLLKANYDDICAL